MTDKVPAVDPYMYFKLSKGDDVSVGIDRQTTEETPNRTHQEMLQEMGYILSLLHKEGDTEEVKAYKDELLLGLKKEQDRRSRARRKAEREARKEAE